MQLRRFADPAADDAERPTLSHKTRKDGAPSGFETGWATRRGWTTQDILDTVRNGDAYPVTNKATGAPATEYVGPNGKFVVIDNETGQVLQVSKVGYAANHWEQ